MIDNRGVVHMCTKCKIIMEQYGRGQDRVFICPKCGHNIVDPEAGNG